MKKSTFLGFFMIIGLTACGNSNTLSQQEGFKVMTTESQDQSSQNTDPAIGSDSNAPKPPHLGGIGPKGENIKHESVEYTGKISSFATNPDKAYDSFVIDVQNEQKSIKFPPHMASQIMKATKVGDTVTVYGESHVTPENTTHIHFKKLSKDGNEISEVKPAFKLPSLSTQTSTTVEGTIKELRKGPKGDINGAYLNDGTIVHMPPKESETLAALLKVGDNIKVTGTLKPTDEEGFVYTEKVKIIKASSVNYNNQDYSLKK